MIFRMDPRILPSKFAFFIVFRRELQQSRHIPRSLGRIKQPKTIKIFIQ